MRNSFKWVLFLSIILIMSCSLEENSTEPSASGTAPSAPTSVTATAGNGQVTIQWQTVTGASSYNIYWSETTGVSPATGTKITEASNPYLHKALTKGATYYYVITAINAYGESSKSDEIAVTLNDAPPAPTGVAAMSGESQVVITWNPVEKATAYTIYWSNTSGLQTGGGNRIADVTSPYTHGGLSNASSYYYVVTAVNDYGESSASGEVSAIPRTDPDNARLRVVWVQDLGDGSDYDTISSNLRLMGLDTGDGRGEREIRGAGNYTKPLITPRGDRVVYTSRTQEKIYIVNWDGSGLRELSGGFGLAVWRDLRDGREWLYYGYAKMQTGGLTCPAVYRTLLDSPGSEELIWNKVSVNVDSFQLSADGRMAGGNFPWPDGGVADLPNKSWTRLGSGCWASLAPDNSYRFWLLDGSHRNIYITDQSGENGRTVNINGAPGIDGYEVYHPRWSNHPLVMAMTGPYKTGSGREVEIYVGRFNAQFSAIESWWQVTNNDFADFFPDVWLSP